MTLPSNAALSKQATSGRAIALGLALAVVGALGAIASTKIQPSWLQNGVLAIATTLFSTGSLALAFELVLRRNVQQEMLRLVGINSSVLAQQIVGGNRSPDIPWPDILNDRSQFKILMIDPSGWIGQNINAVFDNAKNKMITAEFFFPDPTGPFVGEMAAMLKIGEDAYRTSLEEAANRIERTWQGLRSSGDLALGSSLRILWLSHRPQYSLITCDSITVIELTGVFGRYGAEQDYAYLHSGDRSSFPSIWFKTQLGRLAQEAVRFENRV